MKVLSPFILSCAALIDLTSWQTQFLIVCRSPDHISWNLSWICCVFRLIMKWVSIAGLSGWPSWRFKMVMLSLGSKTLLHLFQSHSSPGGKWSLMACKMGGRVSNHTWDWAPSYQRGSEEGICGFWVVWHWWRAYRIFMTLHLKEIPNFHTIDWFFWSIPPHITYLKETPNFHTLKWFITQLYHPTSAIQENIQILPLNWFIKQLYHPIQRKYPNFTP